MHCQGCLERYKTTIRYRTLVPSQPVKQGPVRVPTRPSAAPPYLDADTASDAELLGNNGDLIIGRHLDAEFAHAHHGARALALLATSLRLAAVAVDDGDTGELAALLLSPPLRHGCCPASP